MKQTWILNCIFGITDKSRLIRTQRTQTLNVCGNADVHYLKLALTRWVSKELHPILPSLLKFHLTESIHSYTKRTTSNSSWSRWGRKEQVQSQKRVPWLTERSKRQVRQSYSVVVDVDWRVTPFSWTHTGVFCFGNLLVSEPNNKRYDLLCKNRS